MATSCKRWHVRLAAIALSFVCAFGCLPSSTALAHDVRGSAVYLDIGRATVAAELHLPVAQLRLALPIAAGELSHESLAESELVRAYVREHVLASGRPIVIERASVHPSADGDELVVHGAWHLGDAMAELHAFELQFDAILHRVVTHNAYVFSRRNVWRGRLGDEPEVLSMLHWQQRQLTVDLRQGSVWSGVRATFLLGVEHIAEGTDHLLFLLMLLLPAPLSFGRNRWTTRKPLRTSVITIVKLVSAFTLGHSLTLIIGALRGTLLPSQLVEVVVAASIVVSAAHAFVPILAGRETAIAAGFGLVHGLAFASTLSAFEFDTSSLVLALFGFNLGIEVMQLAIVLLVMPWLMLTAHHGSYHWLRNVGAIGGVIAGLAWIAERTVGSGAMLTTWVDRAAEHSIIMLAALALYAFAVNARSLWKACRTAMIAF